MPTRIGRSYLGVPQRLRTPAIFELQADMIAIGHISALSKRVEVNRGGWLGQGDQEWHGGQNQDFI
jgi:hypothetical protein